MKCNDCLNLMEAYLDREARDRETEQVESHLATCANCANAFEALTAENEILARYDRELEISPATWNGIAARIALEARQHAKSRFSLRERLAGLFGAPSFRFAMPAVALVLIAMLVGLAYWRTRQVPTPGNEVAVKNAAPSKSSGVESPKSTDQLQPGVISASSEGSRQPNPIVAVNYHPKATNIRRAADQNDVLPDVAADIEEKDTTSHLEQAQNLLLSFRDIKYSDTDEEVDVSYEKTESRRLLSENIMLRRDAENAGKFPAKSMLGSLEPFLIDIANLPDKAKPSEVRQINDRVQRTEIVAELRGY